MAAARHLDKLRGPVAPRKQGVGPLQEHHLRRRGGRGEGDGVDVTGRTVPMHTGRWARQGRATHPLTQRARARSAPTSSKSRSWRCEGAKGGRAGPRPCSSTKARPARPCCSPSRTAHLATVLWGPQLRNQLPHPLHTSGQPRRGRLALLLHADRAPNDLAVGDDVKKVVRVERDDVRGWRPAAHDALHDVQVDRANRAQRLRGSIAHDGSALASVPEWAGRGVVGCIVTTHSGVAGHIACARGIQRNQSP